MSHISKAIEQLNQEIKFHNDAIFHRENAINRLRIVEGSAHAKGVATVRPKRHLSKAARARIAEAQRKRWAEQKKLEKAKK